ncbi:MAG: hypothetical protein ACTTJZ_09035 [Sphaerochaetaceae bacterium]
MKNHVKTIIASAIEIALCALFVGCNLNATQGIFRAVSESAESSDYRILGAAGYDMATQKAYLVTTGGIHSKTEGGALVTIAGNTAARQIKQASYYNDGAKDCVDFISQDPTSSGGAVKYWTYDITAGNATENADLIKDLSAGFKSVWTNASKNELSISYLGSAKAPVTISGIGSVTQFIGSLDASGAAIRAELLVSYKDAGNADKLELIIYNGGTDTLARKSLTSPSYDIAAFALNPDTNTLVLIGRSNRRVYYIADITSSTAALDSGISLSDSFTASPSAMFYDHTEASGDMHFLIKGNAAYTDLSCKSDSSAFGQSTTTSGFAAGLIVTTPNIIKIGTRTLLAFTSDNGVFKMKTDSSNPPTAF